MKAPKPPNPYDVAAAQAQANQQSQIPFNQSNQYGQQTTTQTGTRTVPAVYRTNKKGKQILVTPAQEVPVYTQTTQLTPAQQKLLHQTEEAGSATNELGLQQIGQLKELLGNPLDLSKENTSEYITELARKRLDPIWNQKAAEMDTRLKNQGLSPTDKAYKDAMAVFDYGRNDAYNSMLLQGRNQGIQEMLTQRNQPINETTALMSGTAVPLQFGQAGATTPVDVAALQANRYAQDVAPYNAMLGGGAGILGSGLQALGMYAGAPRTTNIYGGWTGV